MGVVGGDRIAVTGILVVTFIIRFVKTRKAMPAALMIVFGVAAMAVMLTA